MQPHQGVSQLRLHRWRTFESWLVASSDFLPSPRCLSWVGSADWIIFFNLSNLHIAFMHGAVTYHHLVNQVVRIGPTMSFLSFDSITLFSDEINS